MQKILFVFETYVRRGILLKYWRGYLIAGIITLFSWGLTAFAKTHVDLIDMVYPYIDRIIMDYLAAWSADFAGCLWQTLLIFGVVLFVASIVLMFVLRWNPVQWFGWVLAIFYGVSFLNTGVYGLNAYAGTLAEDIRLEVNAYSMDYLERAALYYRDEANLYATKVSRNTDRSVKGSDLATLNEMASNGFNTLVYERSFSLFSGNTLPVKTLAFSENYKGMTGKTVGLTGESAINPNVPAVGMPFAVCHEMAHRMCVYSDSEADFSAFLACTANTSPEYAYSGYLMAYRNCYNALAAIGSAESEAILARLISGTSVLVLDDMETYNQFFGDKATAVDTGLTDLLVSWHIQEVARFEDAQQQQSQFDPMDETHENLQDILNPTEAVS